MPNKHTVLLNDNEQTMVEELKNKRGYRLQEILRIGLRMLWFKEFPPYNAKKKKEAWFDDYTPQEYCERIKGGHVEGKYCVINKEGGMVEKIPLSRIKILG